MNIKQLINAVQTAKRRGRSGVDPSVLARRDLVKCLAEQDFPTVAAARTVADRLKIDWSKDPGEFASLAWAWTVDALYNAGRMGELMPALETLRDPLRATAEERREEVRAAGRDDSRARPIDVRNWP